MGNLYKHSHSIDSIISNPPKELYIKKPLYIGTNTSTDNPLKVTNNKDTQENTNSTTYDFLSLRNILREEMDKPITVKQAERRGNALLDIYPALYFEDL
jgi:UDP-N-acetylmuramyl tripeptide synthase